MDTETIKYYWIKDLEIVGKKENNKPYLYNKKDKKWELDNKHILTDRIIGYSLGEIGNTDMMEKVTNISKEHANKLMKN